MEIIEPIKKIKIYPYRNTLVAITNCRTSFVIQIQDWVHTSYIVYRGSSGLPTFLSLI